MNKFKKMIPNILTSLRIVMTPFTVLSILTGNFILTASLISATALTDLFDGMLARKFNAESKLGAMLDQIADKIFSGGAIIALAIATNPLIILNLLGEISIMGVNAVAKKKGLETKSSILGKIKTGVLSVNLLITYISTFFPILKPIITILISITGILQLITSIDYAIKHNNQEAASKNIEDVKQAEIITEDSESKNNKHLEQIHNDIIYLQRIKDTISHSTDITPYQAKKKLKY